MSRLFSGSNSTSVPLQPIFQPLTQTSWDTVDVLERGPHLKRTLNVETSTLAQTIDSAASLRFVLGPSDAGEEWYSRSLGRLYEIFRIPDEFTLERVQSVSHSFGSSSADNEFCSWFHFLCRYIPDDLSGSVGAARYWKAGFFIRRSAALGVTLVCFSPPPTVLKRLELFIDGPSWSNACKTPYVLFNLILGALFLEVDETVWTMGTIFSKIEREVTDHVDGTLKFREQKYYRPPFGTLHRYANDLAYLKETVESNLLVTEAILDRTGGRNLEHTMQTDPPPTENDLLKEGLLYHQSLFRSTQLRLCSLEKRIQNAINLAFHMVTQQDSLIMMHDSASVTILTAVAAVFLPITTIATIIGSQLFVTDQDKQGNWNIIATPLIRYLYVVGIPMTVVILIASYFWSIRRRLVWSTGANTGSTSRFKPRLWK